eukprot:CAMPEP_0113941660 /NCGR_PEP_ID=MMETSP1339-20121228/7535_1 /TAXON_ID=94617 /ORGANISM="Fibrocapsa japonica" /LENGTH=596 /DNA_ID=CAMNT_0000945867 /DNA_START=48 /DNA_END=1839 /DNA_ORIENTATION=+ /assembly_acc=CAM_ASM_000762
MSEEAGKIQYQTPGPDSYRVEDAYKVRYKTASSPSFGGAMAQVDRERTGIRAGALARADLPAPDLYSTQAADQAANLRERSGRVKFGQSKRDDGAKMFLGKGLHSPGNSRFTPGPGAYADHQNNTANKPKAPSFSFGGNMAQVDRVKTGQYAEAMRSFTPGPGEYVGANQSMLGSVNTSTKRSSPNSKFGSSTRFQPLHAVGSVGGQSGGMVFAKADEDKPMAESVQSSMAGQSLSTRRTMPSFSFGAKAGQEVLATGGGMLIHCPKTGISAPSPVDYQKPGSTLGRSLESKLRSSPEFSFGTGGRFNMKSEGLPGLETPGPNFSGSSSLSKQNLSKNSSSPAFSFGTATHRLVDLEMRKEQRQNRPGPGTYDSSSSCGKQVISKSSSAPQYSFGTSKRDKVCKQYISKLDSGPGADMNASFAGRETPGPGTYPVTQQSSTKKDAPKYSFGLKTRNARELRPSTTPEVGPGRYDLNSGIGSQKTSGKTSAPTYSIGTSTRDRCNQVMQPGFKANSMMKTPGPGEYASKSSVDTQVLLGSGPPSAAGSGKGTSSNPPETAVCRVQGPTQPPQPWGSSRTPGSGRPLPTGLAPANGFL